MRVFYAVALPDVAHARVEAAQEALKRAHASHASPGSPVSEPRWTVPEQHHVTLKFLGSVRRDSLSKLQEILREASARPPFEVVASGLAVFGSPARARVLNAKIDDPSGALTALACDFEAAAEERFAVPRETRSYKPHVTLARFKGGADVRELLREVELEPLWFVATKVRLYESVLASQARSTRGRYTVLDEVALGEVNAPTQR